MRARLVTISLVILLSLSSAVVALGAAEEKTVAVMWVGQSGMSKRITMSMMTRLHEIAPQIKVVLRPMIDSMEQAEKIFRDFESSVDGIVFLRGTGAQFLAKANAKVPCFVGATNNPKLLGVINNLEAPEGNITGVSYYIPYEKRFQVIQSLFPKCKRVCLVAERGHPSSSLDLNGTKEQCRILGWEFHEVLGSTTAELVRETEKIVGKVDLIILAENRLVQESVVNLLPVTNSNKVPIFSYSEKPTRFGAVAGLVSRDDVRGGMLADSIADVIVHKKPISKVPVKMEPDLKLQLNQTMMEVLGIPMPAKLPATTVLVR